MLLRRSLGPSAAALVLITVVLVGCGAAETADESVAAGAPVPEGQSLYTANCAQCHGADLTGTGSGPPLLHEYYLPDHHSDEAFRFAMEFGVQPHHWRFGPMPPQPQIDDAEAEEIITFIRDAQRQAGLLNG